MTMTMLLATALASAQPVALPEGIATMIEQAGETGDSAKLKAVMHVARAAFPDSEDELAALETAANARTQCCDRRTHPISQRHNGK